MPYKYVKTWFEDRFPYYSDQPTFDDDGFIVDPATPEQPEGHGSGSDCGEHGNSYPRHIC